MPEQIQIPDKIIIVGGLPRTGKTILRNALGSHSQIAFTPSGFNFFYWFSENKFHARGGFDANLKFFFEECWISKTWRITQGSVLYTGKDRRDLYLVILEAFRQTYFKEKQYVGTYIHVSEEYFDTLIKWFGWERLKFIQIIRNPYDNYGSYVLARNVCEHERKPNRPSSFVHKFCHMWGQSTTMALFHGLKHPDTCRTLFFEDVKESPRNTIKGLCSWLGVSEETERMLAMHDFSVKQNSAFQLDGLPNNTGFICKDNYDRRKHLNKYEIDAISAIASTNLLHTMDYENQNVVINYKFHRNNIDSVKYTLNLHLMARSYLSPIHLRQVVIILLRHTVHSLKDVSFALIFACKKLVNLLVKKLVTIGHK